MGGDLDPEDMQVELAEHLTHHIETERFPVFERVVEEHEMTLRLRLGYDTVYKQYTH